MKLNHKLSQTKNNGALAGLRRRWWSTALVYGLWVGLGYWWLPTEWQRHGYALRWALLAAAVLGYLLIIFYRALPKNHRRDESELLPTLGLGNSLTLVRGLFIGLLAGFLFLPQPTAGLLAWMPAILYLVISLLDFVDGYAARVTHHVTNLGETLDGVCDALGLLVAITLLVWYGQLPGWYLLVGLARYLFGFGQWWRQRHHRPVFPLPPSARRRLTAGFQMGFISVALWPMFSPPATTLAAIVFAAPLLAGFWRDWLVVSGRINPKSPRYRRLHAHLTDLLDGWLPPLLRAVVTALSLMYLLPIALSTTERHSFLLWPDSPAPALTTDLLAGLAVATTLLLALGSLTRLAALGLLAPLAITILTLGLNILNGLMLIGVILLMLLGGGKWSLWRLDDRLVTVKAGEAR